MFSVIQGIWHHHRHDSRVCFWILVDQASLENFHFECIGVPQIEGAFAVVIGASSFAWPALHFGPIQCRITTRTGSCTTLNESLVTMAAVMGSSAFAGFTQLLVAARRAVTGNKSPRPVQRLQVEFEVAKMSTKCSATGTQKHASENQISVWFAFSC